MVAQKTKENLSILNQAVSGSEKLTAFSVAAAVGSYFAYKAALTDVQGLVGKVAAPDVSYAIAPNVNTMSGGFIVLTALVGSAYLVLRGAKYIQDRRKNNSDNYEQRGEGLIDGGPFVKPSDSSILGRAKSITGKLAFLGVGASFGSALINGAASVDIKDIAANVVVSNYLNFTPNTNAMTADIFALTFIAAAAHVAIRRVKYVADRREKKNKINEETPNP